MRLKILIRTSKSTISENQPILSLISGFMNFAIFISKPRNHFSSVELLNRNKIQQWLYLFVWNMEWDFFIQWCPSFRKNCIKSYLNLKEKSRALPRVLIQSHSQLSLKVALNISNKSKKNSKQLTNLQVH